MAQQNTIGCQGVENGKRGIESTNRRWGIMRGDMEAKDQNPMLTHKPAYGDNMIQACKGFLGSTSVHGFQYFLPHYVGSKQSGRCSCLLWVRCRSVFHKTF